MGRMDSKFENLLFCVLNCAVPQCVNYNLIGLKVATLSYSFIRHAVDLKNVHGQIYSY